MSIYEIFDVVGCNNEFGMILTYNMYGMVGYLHWYGIDMLNDFMLVGLLC